MEAALRGEPSAKRRLPGLNLFYRLFFGLLFIALFMFFVYLFLVFFFILFSTFVTHDKSSVAVVYQCLTTVLRAIA
ncbi:MAG: hypothetical protein OEL83_17555 [Desulforhopalus sp.]|nr:hypothetical protein [Desulforhopalus sp.]